MSKKLFTVQAVLKPHFENRPQQGELHRMPSGLGRRIYHDMVLPIPADRRPTVLHGNRSKAVSEAERLAKENPNYVFLVMESTHMAMQQEFVSRPMEGV